VAPGFCGRSREGFASGWLQERCSTNANKFASGKYAIAQCDRCGFRYKLKQLKEITIKTKNVNILVCPTCWEPDQPQLQLGMYPVNDPQAIRNPRQTQLYVQAGLTGLQLENTSGPSTDETGVPSGGSRIIQWGYAPVGGSRANDVGLTPNNLALSIQIGTVTVVTT
jgi:hypothetical protein